MINGIKKLKWDLVKHYIPIISTVLSFTWKVNTYSLSHGCLNIITKGSKQTSSIIGNSMYNWIKEESDGISFYKSRLQQGQKMLNNMTVIVPLECAKTRALLNYQSSKKKDAMQMLLRKWNECDLPFLQIQWEVSLQLYHFSFLSRSTLSHPVFLFSHTNPSTTCQKYL